MNKHFFYVPVNLVAGTVFVFFFKLIFSRYLATIIWFCFLILCCCCCSYKSRWASMVVYGYMDFDETMFGPSVHWILIFLCFFLFESRIRPCHKNLQKWILLSCLKNNNNNEEMLYWICGCFHRNKCLLQMK